MTLQHYLSALIGLTAFCVGACGVEANDLAEESANTVEQALVPVDPFTPISRIRYCGGAQVLVTGYFDRQPLNGLRRGYRGGVLVVEGAVALAFIKVTENVTNRVGPTGDYSFNPTVRAGSVYVGQHQGTSKDTTLWASRVFVSLTVQYQVATLSGTVSCPAVTFASP